MRLNRLFISIVVLIQLFLSVNSYSDIFHSEFPAEYKYRYSGVSIKTVNGKFYAYIVLLFNENPHFVNLIQKLTVHLYQTI